MKYYRVMRKKEELHPAFDGLYYYGSIEHYKYKNGLRFSEYYKIDALYTERELYNFFGITAANLDKFPFFEVVEISKNNICFAFGFRFEIGHGVYFDKDENKKVG